MIKNNHYFCLNDLTCRRLLCLPKQLGKLLTYFQNLKENAKVDLALLTGCTLFVANKWDLIEKEEREEVKKAQIEQLSKKLRNLNPKSQIVYLSCKTAQLAQTYGVITGDFYDLIAGISNLVVSSMKNNLQKYCRWEIKVRKRKIKY